MSIRSGKQASASGLAARGLASVTRFRSTARVARRESSWPALSALPVNTLITGDEGTRRQTLARTLGRRAAPICFRDARQELALSTARGNTLVLDHIEDLGRADQDALLRWLEGAGAGVRVVSLASVPLFDLVTKRRFNRDLYYRLCIIQSEPHPH
jgi:hypothetical protein